MAIEAKRGCGYRKVGGLYMVGPTTGHDCCKLPVAVHVCPVCAQGIKQTRGWSWIDPRPWLAKACSYKSLLCPAAAPEQLGERVGLLWIGRQFYPTPASFLHEAKTLGISRRISAVPRGFKVGVHWVFLAHPDVPPFGGPAIFSIFRPTAFEKIVTETQAHDKEFMADLTKRGICAVVVPDDDKDHQGTVYDEADDPQLPLDNQQPAAEDHHAR
jgi:hypothetical protein